MKKLILLVKYRFKTEVKAKVEVKFKSVLLELLCLHVWEEQLRSSDYDLLEWFHATLKLINQYTTIRSIWTDKYDADQIPDDLRAQRPLVVDPENP